MLSLIQLSCLAILLSGAPGRYVMMIYDYFIDQCVHNQFQLEVKIVGKSEFVDFADSKSYSLSMETVHSLPRTPFSTGETLKGRLQSQFLSFFKKS